jgi:hypothetical protein
MNVAAFATVLDCEERSCSFAAAIWIIDHSVWTSCTPEEAADKG